MTTGREMYACWCATEFAAQAMLRLRHELRNLPCVVLNGEPPVQTVASLNTRARRLGLTRGMTKVEVDTFSGVTILQRSRTEEEGARQALLGCASRFSPRVEVVDNDDEFIMVIDVTGSERLLGKPTDIAKAMTKDVRALGVSASVVISASFHVSVTVAQANARKGTMTVIDRGKEAEMLSLLPLKTLNVSHENLETLTAWGIRDLGMLAALPEIDMVARLGQEGKRLHDLAKGCATHLFQPVEQRFALEETIQLDVPIELLEGLLFVFGRMLGQLITRASTQLLALASITMQLQLEGGGLHQRTIRPALPTNDRKLWLKLVQLDLEAHPPQRSIVQISVHAESGDTSRVQLGIFSPQLPEPSRLDVTLARIRSIVGDDNVGAAVLQDTHRRDAFRVEPFAVRAETIRGWTGSETAIALRVMRPPENVAVSVNDEGEMVIFYRQKRYKTEAAYGPWLTSGEWWTSSRWTLHEWDVVARHNDEILCCVLVNDVKLTRWQLVGRYD